MQHLLLEQCKKLQELEFPQENVSYYYILSIPTGKPLGLVDRITMSGTTFNDEKTCVACPLLEEVLDWLDLWKVEIVREYPDQEHVTVNAWNNHKHYLAKGTDMLDAIFNLVVTVKRESDV